MFYDNFLKLCNKVNKSPTAVALENGLKGSTVTRWKSGSIPTDATLQKIADYFGVSKEYLLGDFKVGSELEKILQKASCQFDVPYQEIKNVFFSDLYKMNSGMNDLNEENVMHYFSEIYELKKPTVNNDAELTEYLEELSARPEMKMLFKVSKGATKEQVEQVVKMFEAFQK